MPSPRPVPTFNPTLVRLGRVSEVSKLRWDDIAFNPTLVRLGHDAQLASLVASAPFNPTLVRLGPAQAVTRRESD